MTAAEQCGARVILFVDPDPTLVSSVASIGADGIEIYTGSYAASVRAGSGQSLLNSIAETAQRASDLALAVNIGHDLNLQNLPHLVATMPAVSEASIGHELTADALTMGFKAAVVAYKAALAKPHHHSADRRDPRPGD